MIRRDWPLHAEEPESWLLIPQVEHARMSGELAAAWGGPNVPPLACPRDEPGHPLAGVRRELLDAVFHHDDGWVDTPNRWRIDPRHGRPCSFTEMPPADAQRIWTDSIAACREFGPLAGWVAASHFHFLQSRRDADDPEWATWLRETDAARVDWLAEWRGGSPHHAQELADRCLLWLQALDWISLWVCLHGYALPSDAMPAEPLVIGGGATGWPKFCFESRVADNGVPGLLRVSPWPFLTPTLELSTPAATIAARRYSPSEPPLVDRRETLAWRLVPADD